MRGWVRRWKWRKRRRWWMASEMGMVEEKDLEKNVEETICERVELG